MVLCKVGNYLYKYGDIEVYNKFQQPTKKLLYEWRREFLENTHLDNYDVLFMGNAAERIFGVSKIPTYDIDIILSGEIDSYENLSNIFNTAFKIGLKNNLCIDIFHIDKNVFTTEWWGEYNQIRFYDRIKINGKPDIIGFNNVERLPYGLYKSFRNQINSKSYHKHTSRIESAQYLSLRFNLKTMKLISYN